MPGRHPVMVEGLPRTPPMTGVRAAACPSSSSVHAMVASGARAKTGRARPSERLDDPAGSHVGGGAASNRFCRTDERAHGPAITDLPTAASPDSEAEPARGQSCLDRH